MSITTTRRAPGGCSPEVRVVIQSGPGFVRFQRVTSLDEADAVRRQWQRQEYRHWPGRLLQVTETGFLKEQSAWTSRQLSSV